jgi:hypothetical protein
MRNKKFHGFTLSPEVVEEFKIYAAKKGSNASYEVERLMRKELQKTPGFSGWTEERYLKHIQDLQKHIQDLYDDQDKEK